MFDPKCVDFAVLESRWDENSNVSVKPIFDLISTRYLANSRDAIPYERFLGKDSFCEAVEFFTNMPHISTLYIGCHGSDRGIGSVGKIIHLRNLLDLMSFRWNETHRGKLSGLFFGACSFGNSKNIERVMENEPQIKWVAGYEDDVDWGQSTILDGLFMMEYVKEIGNKYNFLQKNPGLGLHYNNRISDIIERVYIQITDHHRGLCDELGFNVFIRKTRGSQIKNMRLELKLIEAERRAAKIE